MTIKEFTPTRLYIKRHTITNLRYFGKTSQTNVLSYLGSGVYWKKHLKKHGKKFVVTDWVSDWFYDPIEIQEFALALSELFDIVKSGDWANLTEEDGLCGGNTGIWENPEFIASAPERNKKISDSVKKIYQNENWMETTFIQKVTKERETKSSVEWKTDVWNVAIQEREIKKSSHEWQSTIGVEQRRKHSDTINSVEWKNTIGVAKKAKESATKSSPEWKLAHSSVCPHCGMRVPNCNINRWHNDNCKSKINS